MSEIKTKAKKDRILNRLFDQAVFVLRNNNYGVKLNMNKKVPKLLGLCRKCKWLIIRQQDWCICQPTMCYRCCECDIDCEVCNCKHRRK